MKKNDIVEYIGCSKEQIRWGNNDDPTLFLVVGKEYIIEKVDVHSQHTKIKLYNKVGWFNSVCFKLKHSEVNSSLEYLKDMDPDSIQLETTSKLFEYEKLSREIENCEDLDTVKVMARCFIKLYLRHQEVTVQTMKML
jgi:hypothetical protein